MKLQEFWKVPAAQNEILRDFQLREAQAARRKFTDAEYDAARKVTTTKKALAAKLRVTRQGLDKYEGKRFGKR